jgi:hypothetical protein
MNDNQPTLLEYIVIVFAGFAALVWFSQYCLYIVQHLQWVP